MPRIFLPGKKFVFLAFSGAAPKNTTATVLGYGNPSGDDFVITSGVVAVGGLLPLTVQDAELLSRFSSPASYFSLGARFEATARLDSENATWNSGYYLYTAGTALRLYKATTQLASYTYSGTGTHLARFQLNGTSLKVKTWQDGNSEPGWQIQTSDSTYSSGYLGLGAKGDRIVNWIGIGTDGASPPTSGGIMTVSGQVTRGGSAVQGAKVTAVKHVLSTSLPLIPGIHVVEATTDSNGNYTLSFDTDDPGPWLISARAIINGVYYASDARLLYLSS